ncbi:MAG: hypothetical protein PHP17_06700 [Candidatus Omnitrophica bacterium]|nr:hypothetical protein [Candidatus Omnitrophota bacterium]
MKTIAEKYLFWILLAVCIFAFFGKKDIRNIKIIEPEIFEKPVQLAIANPEKIEFESNGYAYRLTPLYDYTLKGLIVSKFNYDIFNAYRYGSVFPVDLCMIWGNNAKGKAHLNKDVQFSQDCRWCNVRWFNSNTVFDLNEMANSHIVVKEQRIRRIVNGLSAGDQISIKGKLVNIKARLLKKAGSLDAEEFTWQTSTTRDDQGAGACEVIYVEDITMLKKGNLFFHYLFFLSFWGVVILAIYKIWILFMG